MTAYGVIVPLKYAAKDVDSYNRSVVSAAATENGFIMELTAYSSTADEKEVWSATQPATSHLSNLWMAFEPEIVVTNSQYKGLDPDPRNFIVPIGDVFSVFKPQIGDIILMSEDAVTGTKNSNEYVVATNGAWQLTWAAAAVSGLSLHLLDTQYISIGLGTVGSNRITAYRFEVVAVA